MNSRLKAGFCGVNLRTAIGWAIDDGIFAKLKFHGNCSGVAFDLILLAVVGVWSCNSTLTGAFAEAHAWSVNVLDRVALGTDQGFLKSLVSATVLAGNTVAVGSGLNEAKSMTSGEIVTVNWHDCQIRACAV